MISISIRNQSSNELPEYATTGAAGLDIRAHLSEAITLQPLERRLIPTGLFLEIPVGYEVQIRPRSGLALKQQITVLNSPGTIDSDYRGEIKIILINHGKSDFMITPGMRIAQMVFAPVMQAVFTRKSDLAITKRGEGGFGHTGTH